MMLNKKGQDGGMIAVFIFGGIFILLAFSGLYHIWDYQAEIKPRNEACTKIGMEYYYMDSTTFCIDKNNQAHYVKIECDRLGFRKYNCNPRLISIGEIRTKPGGD